MGRPAGHAGQGPQSTGQSIGGDIKAFNHTNARTLAEARTALASGKAALIAGGTDLIGILKDKQYLAPHEQKLCVQSGDIGP